MRQQLLELTLSTAHTGGPAKVQPIPTKRYQRKSGKSAYEESRCMHKVIYMTPGSGFYTPEYRGIMSVKGPQHVREPRHVMKFMKASAQGHRRTVPST
jgi:hypothetical protein